MKLTFSGDRMTTQLQKFAMIDEQPSKFTFDTDQNTCTLWVSSQCFTLDNFDIEWFFKELDSCTEF